MNWHYLSPSQTISEAQDAVFEPNLLLTYIIG